MTAFDATAARAVRSAACLVVCAAIGLLAVMSGRALAADYVAAGPAPGLPSGYMGDLDDARGAVRVKDIVDVEDVRDNQLVGYGLVVGLQGSGDSMQNAPFTEQSMQSMLDRMGVNVRERDARSRNVAAVTVTADLPAFIETGSRIDITVSAIGDATSLRGGTLVMTPLYGGDGKIYAVGQGQLVVSGFTTQGANESVTEGVPTAGRIPNGALVEREVPGGFDTDGGGISVSLYHPDFNTAIRVVDVINAYARSTWGQPVAREKNHRVIALDPPANISTTRFIAAIGMLRVEPDQPARVVIDESSGTVVIGQHVKISTVALTHGNLTVRISELPQVSQPAPLSAGDTVVTSETLIDVEREGGNFAFVGGMDLEAVVRGLNRIGLDPAGIIAILQAIDTAGALQAELVVQ